MSPSRVLLLSGPLRDIEDLGITTVACPWHQFLVSIDHGLKAYQAIEIVTPPTRPLFA